MTDRMWMLPIEPLELRYSGQWLDWWDTGLRDCGWVLRTVHREGLVGRGVETGQFLDAYNTNLYKSWQAMEMSRLLRDGAVQDDDWVFLHDGWNPTVTALAYMRSVGGVKFRMAAYLHAGTWDPFDHLSACGMGTWARGVEETWLQALDVVLLGTHFHADLICATFGQQYRDKMRVVGMPLYRENLLSPSDPRLAWQNRPRRVVFPHRMAPEKQPDKWEALVKLYKELFPTDDAQFVTTADKVQSMRQFYAVLGSSRVAFSAALQETFGIAMQEAVMLGCYPVVPDRLAYRELFDTSCRYATLEEAAHMVRAALDAPGDYGVTLSKWEGTVRRVSDLLRAWPG